MGRIRGTFTLANPVRPELAPVEESALANSGAVHLYIPEHLALQLCQIQPQAANRHLDRHFPEGGLAHKHLRLRGPHPLHHSHRQAWIVAEAPQQQVGVEQQPHHRRASNNPSRRALKSSATAIRERHGLDGRPPGHQPGNRHARAGHHHLLALLHRQQQLGDPRPLL